MMRPTSFRPILAALSLAAIAAGCGEQPIDPDAPLDPCIETAVHLTVEGREVPFALHPQLGQWPLSVQNDEFHGGLLTDDARLLVQFVGLDAGRLEEGAVFDGGDFRLFMTGNVHPDQQEACFAEGPDAARMAVQVYAPQPGEPMVVRVEGIMDCGGVEAHLDACVVSTVPEPEWLEDQ